MKLRWAAYNNPVYDTSSAFWFDFSGLGLIKAGFSTYAQGGFGNAELEIDNPSEGLISDWFDNGLTKRIVAWDGAGNMAWEGFVAEIEATIGSHRYVRSIDDYCNRVFVDYVYGGGSCPKGSTCNGRVQRNESDVTTATTQAEYGIKEKWVSMGKSVTTSAYARAAADLLLRKSLTARSIELSLKNNQELMSNTLRLSLFGYYSTLQWRKANFKVTYPTDIAEIVKRALNLGHAQFISNDTGMIESTGNTIKYNTNGTLMWTQDFIQGALIDGDSEGKDLYFQILENRKPVLFSRTTAPRYLARENDTRIWNKTRGIVEPHMMRAGAYLMMENFARPIEPAADMQRRDRITFIERTSYDDITETLTLPAPSTTTITTERLLARARRSVYKYI